MSGLVRILSIVLLAAFGAVTAAHAAAATDMSLKMSTAGMDKGGMADRQDCSGDNNQASACDQFCVTTLAAICTPTSDVLPAAADVLAIHAAGQPADRPNPPDPHPPRTVLLN